jgi:hypothetical protein
MESLIETALYAYNKDVQLTLDPLGVVCRAQRGSLRITRTVSWHDIIDAKTNALKLHIEDMLAEIERRARVRAHELVTQSVHL